MKPEAIALLRIENTNTYGSVTKSRYFLRRAEEHNGNILDIKEEKEGWIFLL